MVFVTLEVVLLIPALAEITLDKTLGVGLGNTKYYVCRSIFLSVTISLSARMITCAPPVGDSLSIHFFFSVVLLVALLFFLVVVRMEYAKLFLLLQP